MSAPVFISGVGKRLGLALAKHLLLQDIPVVGTYRSLRPGVEELFDLGATLYQCDFYQADDVSRLLGQVREQQPALRALIHNASDWLPESSEHSPAEVIEKMMTVHASVPYQMNLAWRSALEAGAKPLADIIHITDYVAASGSRKHIAYAASKAAMENMTLSFAAEYAPKVKVNSIAPALMLFNPEDDQDYRQKTLAKALLPREGGEAEFISSVEYLINSQYITGQTLTLNGGRHLR